MWEHVGRDVSKVRRNQIIKGPGSHNQEASVILKKRGGSCGSVLKLVGRGEARWNRDWKEAKLKLLC